MSTNTVLDIQEEIIKALLSVDVMRLANSIQYGLMMNPGLLNLLTPSIELITGIPIDKWRDTSDINIEKWIYQFEWLVPEGYSICVDYRKNLFINNPLISYLENNNYYKLTWDICNWYYKLVNTKKKGLVITCNKDAYLEREVNWLKRGLNNKIKIIELKHPTSLNNLYKNYQLAIYEGLELIDKVKVKSNIMYYLSHTYLIENFSKGKSLNINSINKY